MNGRPSFVDFHTHSSYSDGLRTPAALVRLYQRYGIGIASLTDHMTLAGIDEAMRAARRYGIRLLPGIELYTRLDNDGRELHLIGLNVDPTNLGFLSWLAVAGAHHDRWFDATVARLAHLGFPMPAYPRRAYRSVYPAFPHLHALMVRTATGRRILRRRFGALPLLFELINTYFTPSCDAHVPDMHLPIATSEAIQRIREAGGIPILAHPGHHLQWSEGPQILALQRAGLMGIEVIHPYHSWHQIEHYQEFADTHGLVASGGTDYHADARSPIGIARQWDYLGIPSTAVRELLTLLR